MPSKGHQHPSVQRRAERMIAEHGFLGVPTETFERGGREQLIDLLREGLEPSSRVVELGCGCLRVAYWLVSFLAPRRYCGIDPARRRIELGLEYLFEPGALQHKQPRFDNNPNFDTSAFGVRFDYFVARSIWTHASKPQIRATLDSFLRDATDSAIFLASYLPARHPDEDYMGDRWVGTSHESDVPGVIRHSLDWIRGECDGRALLVEEIGGIDCDSQSWLRVRRR